MSAELITILNGIKITLTELKETTKMTSGLNTLVNFKENTKMTSGLNTLVNFKENTKLINEHRVYQLIMKSKLPLAENFQDLVYEEVLPSIRKNGEYKMKKE